MYTPLFSALEPRVGHPQLARWNFLKWPECVEIK